MSVCPLSAWKNSALTRQIIMKLGIDVFLESLSRKFKFHQNLAEITCTLHEDQYTFLIISFSVLLRMQNVSKFVEKLKKYILYSITFSEVGQVSIVGIAIFYSLGGPEIKSQWGQDFPHPFRPAHGAHPTSYTMGTGSFPGVKQLGRGNHPPASSTKVKESVDLYLYFPFGPLWPILG